MDQQRFDGIARALATATSRRTAMRLVFGGVAGLSLMWRTGTVEASNERVTLCHQGDSGPETITVAEPAVKAHLAHGDVLGPCPTPKVCTPQALLGPDGTGIPCTSIIDCPCGLCSFICVCVNPGNPCVQGSPGSEDQQCCSGSCGAGGLCDCNPTGAVCNNDGECCEGSCDRSNLFGGLGVCL